MPKNEQRVTFVISHDKAGKLGIKTEFHPKLSPKDRAKDAPMTYQLRQAIAAQIAISVTEQIKEEQALMLEANYKVAVYETGSFISRTEAFNSLKKEGCVSYEDIPHPTDATKTVLKGYMTEVNKSAVAVEPVDKPA